MTAPEIIPLPRGHRGEARRAAILAAAREVFLEHGYGATTLDDIIRRSGGSRATIYQQFGSKEGLFGAIIAQVCADIVAPLAEIEDGGDLETTLRAIGRRYLDALLDPQGLALYRLVVGESG